MSGCDRSALDRLKHWRVRSSQGRVIFAEGDTATAFYRVESGCVRLQKYRADGQRVILTFCFPGDVFGVDPRGRRAAAAEAASACELSRFPLEQDFDGVASEVLSASAEMVAELAAHLTAVSHASAEDRLMWFLQCLAARLSTDGEARILRPPMNRRDMADFLDLAPETLSRTFARLAERGQILASGRTLILTSDGGPGGHGPPPSWLVDKRFAQN